MLGSGRRGGRKVYQLRPFAHIPGNTISEFPTTTTPKLFHTSPIEWKIILGAMQLGGHLKENGEMNEMIPRKQYSVVLKICLVL